MFKKFLKEAFAEIFIGLIPLVVAWYRLVEHLPDLMEVRLYDESYYLYAGKHFFTQAIPTEFSPLYAFWYWLLAHFQPDGIKLYYLNYMTLSLLMPLSAYIMLRAMGLHRFISLFMALMLLSSGLNLPVWPKMANLMTSITLLSIALLLLLKVRSHTVWLATGIWLSTIFMYMRPEFSLAAVVFIAWMVWHLSRQKSAKGVIWVAATLLPLIILLCTLGVPVGSGPRSMIAFGQHFMHNVWLKQGTGNDELMNTMWVNWREYIQPYFGQATSVPQALMHNPAAFISHVAYNVYNLMFKGLYVLLETQFPNRVFHFSPSVIFLISLLLLAFLLKEHGGLLEVLKRTADFSFRMWWLAIMCIPALAAGLIFQPRQHYIMMLVVPLLYKMGQLYAKAFNKLPNSPLTQLIFIVLAYVLIGFTPTTDKFYRIRSSSPVAAHTKEIADSSGVIIVDDKINTKSIKALNKLDLPNDLRVIDVSTGITFYLDRPFKKYGMVAFELDYPAFENFTRLMEDNQINLVVVDGTLRYDHAFARNKAWLHFLANYATYGFKKVPLAGEAYVLIKN